MGMVPYVVIFMPCYVAELLGVKDHRYALEYPYQQYAWC